MKRITRLGLIAIAFAFLVVLAIGVVAETNQATIFLAMDDANVSGSTIIDISGTGLAQHNGTITGTVVSGTGVLNEGRRFDGSNDYVTIPSSVDFKEDFSLFMWVNTSNIASDQMLLWNQRTSEGYVQARIRSSAYYFYVWDGGTWNEVHTSGLSSNTFHHVGAIYNATTQKLMGYLDGQNFNNVTVNSADGVVNQNTLLGVDGSIAQDLIGHIDEFALYNITLTDAEAKSLYNGGAGENPYNVPTGVSNFTITATNNFGETLQEFNASIDGVTYNTTTGTITTHVLQNSTELYNITVFATNHDNRDYSEYNVSSNLAAVLNFSYYRLNITVTQKLNGNAINKFSVTVNGSSQGTTTNGAMILNLSKNAEYTILVDPENYTTNTSNVTMTSWLVNHSVSVFPTNSLNITFLKESTSEQITDANITFSLIESGYASNHSIGNGTFWIDDLPAGDYEIRYSAAGYDERNYFFTLTNRTYNSLTLYLLNASTDITNTLYDEYGNLLPGYYIKLLRYYVSTNSFVLVDQGLTNFEGKTVLEGVLNDPYYKFIITDTEGNVFKETTSTQLYDSSISHFITLGSPVSEDLSNLNGITTSLTFLTATNQFKYTWDNTDGTAVTANLYIYTTNALGNTLYNTSTTTASSGTMYLAVEEVNGTTYLAEGYIEFSGASEPTLMETLTQSFSQVEEIFGVFGLFLTAIILISMVALGLWSPPVAAIMVGVSLVLTRVAQLHTLEWTYVTAISVVAIIIAYVISDKA